MKSGSQANLESRDEDLCDLIVHNVLINRHTNFRKHKAAQYINGKSSHQPQRDFEQPVISTGKIEVIISIELRRGHTVISIQHVDVRADPR